MLDEIGIDIGAMMSAAPARPVAGSKVSQEDDAQLDLEADALLARLTAM